MKNDLTSRLPLRAKRYTLMLYAPKENRLYHLFSLIEVLEPDMQDYVLPDPKDQKASDALTSKGNAYNDVYYHIETFELTEEVLANITKPFMIDDDEVRFLEDEFVEEPKGDVCYVTDRNQTGTNLSRLFPKRVGPYYIKSYIDKSRVLEPIVLDGGNLQQQVKEMSERFFRMDFTRHPEHLGNIYLAWHHHSLKDVDLTASEDPSGVMISTSWRRGQECSLIIHVIMHRQGSATIGMVTEHIEAGCRKKFIPLPEYPRLIDVYVCDQDDNLLMNMVNVTFIRQFSVSTGIMESRPVFERDGAGNIVGQQKVEKFLRETFHVGKAVPSISDYFHNAEERNAWDLEMKKETIYIEYGNSEQEKEDSIKKAKATIRSIVNMARQLCYVCDIYLGASDVRTFLYDVQDMGVEIRLMSAKETGNKDSAKALKQAIDDYNSSIGRQQMTCRVLRGQDAPLHDRFIIIDDSVWSVGTSLNQIGTRSTLIARIPKAAALKIKAEVERWWGDEQFTEALDSYAED